MTIIGTTSHGLVTGDVITMRLTLSRRQRFLLWLANPFHWPPRVWQRTYYVTKVASSHSVEVSE